MTEIPIGELPKQSAALHQALVFSERETDLFDQVYYAAITLHDLFTGKSTAYEQDINHGIDSYKLFKPHHDGRAYLQAGVPHPGKDMYQVHELDYTPNNRIDMYDLGDRKIIRVPQCHMLQVPKDRAVYFYFTMSTCSAVIGTTGTDLFVAHVGLSERGGLAEFVKYMREHGVNPSTLYAVASLGNVPDAYKGEKSTRFDFTRVESFEDFTRLGIQEDHIRSFEYFPKEASKPNNMAGVIVTPWFVGSYLYDYSMDGSREVCGSIRDLDVMTLQHD